MEALEIEQVMGKPERDESFVNIKTVLDNKGKHHVGFKKRKPSGNKQVLLPGLC